MRFDLKVPCKNCPFRNGPNRITFRGRGRAGEIAETAYRQGFPCHLSAKEVETFDGETEFHAHDEGQHCVGALAVFIQSECGGTWPGIDNDEDRADELSVRLLPIFDQVFESEEAFIEANADPRFDEEEAT